MFLLQVPGADDIAQDVTQTVDGLHTQWGRFWAMFAKSPSDALHFLGSHALGVMSKVAVALVMIWLGRWLIHRIRRFVGSIFEYRRVDSSVRIFFDYLLQIFLWIVLFVVIIGILGWKMTGLVAVFAAAAFAIGMALSGTLSNFAGGILILLMKPYRVGDFIEAQDYAGTVRSIELFNTLISTLDNRTVIMPNGPLSTGIVNNISRQATRMAEWKISLAYGADFAVAEHVALQALQTDRRVLHDPLPLVKIGELNDAAVVMLIRAWVFREDYQNILWDINKILYDALPAAGVDFAVSKSNKIDVNILSKN